jgi:transglutaminase superfamily protein
VIRIVKKYWTLLGVGLVVLRVRLLLRSKSLPLVLDRVTPHSVSRRPDDAVMEDLAYYVDRWLTQFPHNRKGNCFPRSLALYWFARRLGYPVRFQCGVRKDASHLDGHAWLTLESLPFQETGRHWQRYTVTFSYPPDTAAGERRDLDARCQHNRTMVS